MTLKDLLKKKEKIRHGDNDIVASVQDDDPEFTIMRSDTNTQEIIKPPSFPGDESPTANEPPTKPEDKHAPKIFSRLRSSSHASTTSVSSNKSEKRLSQRLHLRSTSRGSNASQGSINVPSDLPDIQDVAVQKEEMQAQWEERATILAKENPNTARKSQDSKLRSRPTTPKSDPDIHVQPPAHLGDRPVVTRSISDAKADESIQEAIRLHEAGELTQSTAMFGRLTSSNAMAQILYGLALRHGWGIEPNPTLAVKYLSEAASNSANVEAVALGSGMKKGGAAKGELVLAIYELANSFIHGWGVEKDPVAARKYYECAANLGDTDAMNEVARCYEEGIGGKKDKVHPTPSPHLHPPSQTEIAARDVICKEQEAQSGASWSQARRSSPRSMYHNCEAEARSNLRTASSPNTLAFLRHNRYQFSHSHIGHQRIQANTSAILSSLEQPNTFVWRSRKAARHSATVGKL